MSSIPPDASKPLSTTTDRPHAPPTDEEAIYFAGSPLLGGHPEKVIVLVVVGAIFMIIPIVVRLMMQHRLAIYQGTNEAHSNGFFVASTGWPETWMTLVLLVTGVCFWIAAFIVLKLIHYRISNYRIDYEHGFFSKDISTLELWHVEDISFHQSIFDRILGIGTIRVIAHDDTMPDLRMRGLPDARKIFEELKQRIIAVKRQSGVLKLDSGI